jgi:hypothetical protein
LGSKGSYKALKVGDKDLEALTAFIFTDIENYSKKEAILVDWLKNHGATRGEIDDLTKYSQNHDLREEAIRAMQKSSKGGEAIAMAKGLSLGLKDNSGLYSDQVNVNLERELKGVPLITTPEFEQRRAANLAREKQLSVARAHEGLPVAKERVYSPR